MPKIARRATRQERGYDRDHFHLRASYQRHMDRGQQFACHRCGTPVDPTNWDLGHTDDRQHHSGPEHPTCNRSAGGRRVKDLTTRPTPPHPGLRDTPGVGT